MEYVIRLSQDQLLHEHAIRTGVVIGPNNGYIAWADVEQWDSNVMFVELSDDIHEAKRFVSFAAAVDFYRAVPTNHPVRSTDNKPNRPLTAWNAEILPCKEE